MINNDEGILPFVMNHFRSEIDIGEDERSNRN